LLGKGDQGEVDNKAIPDIFHATPIVDHYVYIWILVAGAVMLCATLMILVVKRKRKARPYGQANPYAWEHEKGRTQEVLFVESDAEIAARRAQNLRVFGEHFVRPTFRGELSK
jgi:hypothetical protein